MEGNQSPTVCVQIFDGTPISNTTLRIDANLTASTAISEYSI